MDLKSQYRHFQKAAELQFKFYSDRIKFGSKDPEDYMNMSYFAGLLNGYKIAWYPLDNHVTEEEFKEMVDSVLQRNKLEVN